MKRAFWGILFALFFINYGFSEIQLESGVGWFFERNTYTEDIDTSRSINGPMLNIIARFFPVSNWGLFLGIDSDITVSANNDEYIDQLLQQGMYADIEKNWLFTPYGDTIMPLCGYNSHI